MKTERVASALEEKWSDVLDAYDSKDGQPGMSWIWLSIFSAAVFFLALRSSFSATAATIFLIAVTIHELGHYLAMRFYGFADSKIFFLPFLGASTSSTGFTRTSAQRVAVISLAGPVPGLLLGLLFYFLTPYLPQALVKQTAIIFILLNGLNLLPIQPLDGARVLKGLFFSTWPWLILFVQIASIGLVYFLGREFTLFVFGIVLFDFYRGTTAIDTAQMLKIKYPALKWTE